MHVSNTNPLHSYEGDDTPAKPTPAPPAAKRDAPEPAPAPPAQDTNNASAANGASTADQGYPAQQGNNAWGNNNAQADGSATSGGPGVGNANHSSNQPYESIEQDDNYGPINVKEDG
jgi:hypothetical protein